MAEDLDDDYSVNYSFAIEYNGPPVSRDIPQVVPIDVRRIPTASMAAKSVMLGKLSVPIIQPIVGTDGSGRNSSGDSGNIASSDRVCARKPENGSPEESNGGSGTSRVSDHRDHSDSNRFSRSSDESPCNRTHAVTFGALASSDGIFEESEPEPEPEIYRESTRPVVNNDGRKGTCRKCGKTNRFAEKEICIVCGSKYCRKCVLRAMGSMPEGRKCIACIGRRIDESRRGLLGKCSRMLRKVLNDDVLKQVMSDEMTCEVNQLPPHLIFVNDKALSVGELVSLQRCGNPPKKLRPGRYWYDKVSGFWGKEGEKPSQIISSQLSLGYQIRQDASNGDTNVMINNREITKPEFWMLQAAGINCEGNPHFWVTADGSCQHEGMKNVLCNVWERKRVKLLCVALSLPFPSEVDRDRDRILTKIPEHKTMNKLLLVGWDQSGTSTIFKQAKIVYNVPFSDEEKQNIKFVIQRNVYRYLCILLEGHARFEEEFLVEMKRQRAEEPGPSDCSEQIDESNIYSFPPRLKSFSDWLLHMMISGNLDVIFPAATREYSPLVEELWKNEAFQATYKRRNELHTLPRVANYFLDRAVEISQIDYEPSQMDILYAEGITSSNGIASMEFSFPKASQDGCIDSSDENDPSISYQLIRVHTTSLGENCKWLSMFEDINLVIYCVSLTDYDEYYEDINGIRTNKMLATKKLFETIITHQTLADKEFLLILNKFDLLEEKIERAPLSHCEWFHDFNPVISHNHQNANSSSNNNRNSSSAQRAFHYMAVKFKRLFSSLTGRKAFVSRAMGLEADSVDRALRYCKEILKWNDEVQIVSMNDWSSDSMEPSTSV
ncbi:Extra-large guanine nucleotide-binding protein 2 [Orobanche hederae]